MRNRVDDEGGGQGVERENANRERKRKEGDLSYRRSSTSLYPWDITGDPKIPMGNGKRKESPIGERDGAARNTVSRNIPPYGDPMTHPLGRSLSPPPPSPSLPTTSGNVSSNIASTY
uniref:Uncharacterized protein n=1 Tax=Vespula pensylvanica TaxID=30213 RepID=A0A834P9E5_VESPE|nr:hypothetical protein H0235_002157 [Vespula pensylvanica]